MPVIRAVLVGVVVEAGRLWSSMEEIKQADMPVLPATSPGREQRLNHLSAGGVWSMPRTRGPGTRGKGSPKVIRPVIPMESIHGLATTKSRNPQLGSHSALVSRSARCSTLIALVVDQIRRMGFKQRHPRAAGHKDAIGGGDQGWGMAVRLLTQREQHNQGRQLPWPIVDPL